MMKTTIDLPIEIITFVPLYNVLCFLFSSATVAFDQKVNSWLSQEVYVYLQERAFILVC